MSFTIVCDSCKGTDVTVNQVYNGEFTEIEMTCESCGNTNKGES